MSSYSRPVLEAVLFDRDGTLIEDVPYNGDPERVRLMPGARPVVDALRAAGIAVGIVTNQSGIARDLITARQAEAVNERVADLLGGVDAVRMCPHGPDDGCDCRKPAPGLILDACRILDVEPARTAVIGDIGSDIAAAAAAGARSVLVPTPVTRREEVRQAPLRADSLTEAVRLLLPFLHLGENAEPACAGGVH